MKNNMIKERQVNILGNSDRLLKLRILFDDYYYNEFLPLYGPGGIHHIPKERRGLRVDNIEDLEEKGQNVN